MQREHTEHRLDLTRSIELRNLTHTIRITVRVYADDTDPEDMSDPNVFDSPEAYKTYLAKFESGDLCFVYIVATAYLGNMEGSDSIGAVEVSKPSDVKQAVDDHGLIENAIADLTRNALTFVATIAPNL